MLGTQGLAAVTKKGPTVCQLGENSVNGENHVNEKACLCLFPVEKQTQRIEHCPGSQHKQPAPEGGPEEALKKPWLRRGPDLPHVRAWREAVSCASKAQDTIWFQLHFCAAQKSGPDFVILLP